MHWEVDISGDNTDLNMLADAFTGPGLTVSRQDQKYILKAPEFEGLESAGAVREKAKKIIIALSGLSRLVLSAQSSISVGAVYNVDEDGSRGVTVFPEPVNMHIRVFPPTVIIGKSDGTQELHRQADAIAKWLPPALTDPTVAKALRLRNGEDLGWVELYRLYEVIEDDVSRPTIESSGWATKVAINQFKHTANSVTAAGDRARHGKERREPPKKAMKLSTARSFIDSLLKRWLTSKSAANDE